jgi:hypothetical protein
MSQNEDLEINTPLGHPENLIGVTTPPPDQTKKRTRTDDLRIQEHPKRQPPIAQDTDHTLENTAQAKARLLEVFFGENISDIPPEAKELGQKARTGLA